MQTTGFSIVVPTHGRTQLVERLLESLKQARSAFDGPSEVLIVDSSPPDEAEVIRQLCQLWDASYYLADNDVRRKRNLGIQQANQDVVFLIDSDCQAEPNVLLEHRALLAASGPEVAGVLGVTEWHGPEGPVWRILSFASSFTAAFAFATWRSDVPWGTCTNLSIRRAVLLEVGGFDESLPLRVYGEDVDLGLRIGRAGYRIRCNRQALVRHSRETISSLRVALRKAFTTGRIDYHLGQRHPEQLLWEYPGPVLIALLLAVVALVQVIRGGSPWLLLVPLIWIPLFVLGQAALSLLIVRGTWRSLPYRAGAVLLEILFEAGRLRESLAHGSFKRMWTKFLYIREQTTAERERRVIQMWVMLGGLLLLLALVW